MLMYKTVQFPKHFKFQIPDKTAKANPFLSGESGQRLVQAMSTQETPLSNSLSIRPSTLPASDSLLSFLSFPKLKIATDPHGRSQRHTPICNHSSNGVKNPTIRLCTTNHSALCATLFLTFASRQVPFHISRTYFLLPLCVANPSFPCSVETYYALHDLQPFFSASRD